MTDFSQKGKLHLPGMTYEEIASLIKQMGQGKFRSEQIARWVWGSGVYDFEQMSNISKALRRELAEKLEIFRSKLVQRHDASDGVIKLLTELHDGEKLETVIIPSGHRKDSFPRRTVCISTQVGCPMGCKFCASGADGFVRNLTTGEIVEQVLQSRAVLANDATERHDSVAIITNIVLMGMGEPLVNYDNVVKAMRIFNNPKMGEISTRRITLSTVGLPEKIKQLAGENLPVNLAISLHASGDRQRQTLIPAAEKYSIDQIIEACREYFRSTGREITLEYTLIADINDSADDAKRLVDITRRLRCNVNLIRYNPVETKGYKRPDENSVSTFRDVLLSGGVNVNIRQSRGVDVNAACGQLRKRAGYS